ncbi:hypothetical protein NBE98_12210 [Clostridium swellfunianum]|uniref:hypothetical protein n=1 Tax=Clostridium swellfunianum TaxID=1367462 RepID=UPI0020305C96|nr:hypothetical protein [Clostridium swellfunianum]MCM0649139.1 hypothetical protein [Clostridium swellfunianum]
MKKSILISGFLLLAGLVLSGCTVSDFQKTVYNDDAKIAKKADSYNFKSRVGTTTSHRSEIKFGTFYGMDTLWSIDAKEQTEVTVDYDIKIEKGDFKVVLIGPDNKVITIVDGGKTGKQGIKVQKGNSRIKIVGRDAKGNIKIDITGDKNLKIKKLNN